MPDTTLTLATARAELLEIVDDIQPRVAADRVTSATGNSGGTIAQINKLGNNPDGSFVNVKWLILPSGPGGSSTSAEARKVSAFKADVSGNTLVTVEAAFTAQVSSGVTAYVSSVHPEQAADALNAATEELYPDVYTPRRYHHVSGSRAFNGFWDYWSSPTVPEWWAVDASTLTVAQLTESYFGAYGVTLTASSAGARYLKSAPIAPALLNELDGSSLTFHAMLRATAASKGGVSIADGAGTGSIAYHGGDSTWTEVVTTARTMVPSRPGSPVEFHIDVAASATVHVGPVWTEGGISQRRIPIPVSFSRTPTRVREASSEWPSFVESYGDLVGWQSESMYPQTDTAGVLEVGHGIFFPSGLTAGPRLMQMDGMDVGATLSLEADVMEVVGGRKRMLYYKALAYLKRQLKQQVATMQGTQRLLESDWDREFTILMANPGHHQARLPVQLTPRFVLAGRGRTSEAADATSFGS
jgi:hypothetical protein